MKYSRVLLLKGNTIIHVFKDFDKGNGVNDFNVVADAAMIRAENVLQLTQNNINYIVGARLGKISTTLLETIDKNIRKEDNKCIRIKTDNGYLICSYSSVSYCKDKYEMDKQVENATRVIASPSKGKRLKFTQTKNQQFNSIRFE